MVCRAWVGMVVGFGNGGDGCGSGVVIVKKMRAMIMRL